MTAQAPVRDTGAGLTHSPSVNASHLGSLACHIPPAGPSTFIEWTMTVSTRMDRIQTVFSRYLRSSFGICHGAPSRVSAWSRQQESWHPEATT